MTKVAHDGDAAAPYYHHEGYGQGPNGFIKRAGTAAQKTGIAAQQRPTRNPQLFDMTKDLPPPPTPTTPTSVQELDFGLEEATTSSTSSTIPNGSSILSSPNHDALSTSPDSLNSGPFTRDSIPSPHLPLRKRSASDLRTQIVNGHDYYSSRPSRSPTRSVTHSGAYREVSHTHRGRQGALSPTESTYSETSLQREIDAYLPASKSWGRARGMTSAAQNSPNSVQPLRTHSSIPDLRHSARNQVSSTYRPDRGPNSRVVSIQFKSPPPVSWKDKEDLRSSYRSAMTNGSYVTYASSGVLESSDTEERNSVMTRASSVSDLYSKRKSHTLPEDEGMSVDDAIALYMNGFTDDELEKKLDQGIEDIESFFRPSSEEESEKPLPVPTNQFRRPLSKDKPLPDPLESERRPLDMSDEALTIATRYDSKIGDYSNLDLTIPKSPSAPHLLLSPLTAHPVLPPSPDSAPASPTYPEYKHDSRSPSEEQYKGSPSLHRSQGSRRSVKPELLEPVPRDRYGFKKVSQYVTEEEYDAWNIGYTEYLERRRKKWFVLMKQWGLTTENPIRFPPKSDKVKRYVRKGVPPEWRGAAWFWYAGGPAKLAQNPGLYQKLVEDVDKGLLSDIDREIIERDLNRTFPDNIKFKPDPTPEPTQDFPRTNVRPTRTSSKGEVPIIRALRRVLQAFSIHNPNIGYCQSLNFLAGLLLIFLNEDEEKAFILLSIVTTTHLPGTHAKVLEANVDVGVLMTCIKESMPAVWGKIDDIDAGRGRISTNRLPTVSLATTAWFMSCFVGNLPIETVLRVWDSFFYEGSKTLFRIALAIFKSGEWEIRKVSEHMEIFQIVQAIPRKLLDANSLMESCYKRRNGFGHLSQETIDARRKERRTAMQAERERKNGQKNSNFLAPSFTEDMSRPTTREGKLRRAASRAVRHRQPTGKVPPLPTVPTLFD
ncbi:putative gtpase activating protein [Venturia nashicola]|uniref:Putative gtpase activating protein n=1 Tax=Venturia nashicola TaxID=86259 RepID=A0A4Z1PI90_9PEZI|nr:putative gtpase activating protein [Venturia nashicola]TLD37550.1 putative gtpase activating protein [Venturia nashicola]